MAGPVPIGGRLRRYGTSYAMLLPFLALFAAFLLWPLANSLYLSFTSFDGVNPAVFTIAKHRIRGRRVIFLMIIASMMVSWQTTLIPNYVIMRNLGWLDTYTAYIVPGLAKAFVLFFLVQFLQSVPNELIQAARVDGAGEWRIWWQIVLPLLRPALAAGSSRRSRPSCSSSSSRSTSPAASR
ncbi:L-arabinose transport system permease protein AraQ [Nonomuraea coxensis DSM 45129]|uniref:L-arabinose transport system permease protein AraQ n=1 Tax=Nonomuraea coxensis DSM 45129 TaxID=1122611 RepID=A0ABX8U5I6_9ACTN|nr:carbohydrate ABC transporter permease [Nonomuraea coxensis]QYC42950.1 L-arabinose transport system permease protein AraQ [Nonomuraea coxensis DSM 45129]